MIRLSASRQSASNNEPEQTGGRSSFVLTSANLPDHEHSLTLSSGNSILKDGTVQPGTGTTSGDVMTTTTVATPTAVTIDPLFIGTKGWYNG